MKHIICTQNTEEWYRERLGRPTASEFKRIVTTSGALSAQRFDYMYKLIFERICRKPANFFKPTYWMARGSALEAEAAAAFEEYLGRPLVNVGLLTTDDGRIACSPDRVVDWSHAVEIKVPQPWRHIEYSVLGPGNDYFMQLHGIMFVGDFDRISFFSYCPGMPNVIHEIRRDAKIMKMLEKMLPLFVDEVDKHEAAARALGSYSGFSMEAAVSWERGAVTDFD